MRDRVLLIHGHMFKNAGTTLDWSLRRCFEESFLEHRDDDTMRRDGGLQSLVLNNPKLRVISSHWVPLPPPKIEGVSLIVALMLRNPIERIMSVYQFERVQGSNTPGSRYASNASFRDYVRWRMTSDVGPTIRDFQVRFCTGLNADAQKPVDEARFNQAVEFLSNTPLVGLVNQYDRSMVVFEETLKAWAPDIDLSYVRQNTGPLTRGSLQEKIVRIEKELGPDLTQEVYEKNQYDLRLYELAMVLLRTRAQDISGFSTKLADLRRRCKSLQSRGIRRYF